MRWVLRNREGRAFLAERTACAKALRWEGAQYTVFPKEGNVGRTQTAKERVLWDEKRDIKMGQWVRALLVTHVEELGCSPNSDGNLQKATKHWEWCRQIHTLLDDYPSFSVKNGLQVPGVGVEGNFIYIPGKCLWIDFHNSRHLVWLAVLLSIILPLERQSPLHACCLNFTNPFSILTTLCGIEKLWATGAGENTKAQDGNSLAQCDSPRQKFSQNQNQDSWLPVQCFCTLVIMFPLWKWTFNKPNGLLYDFLNSVSLTSPFPRHENRFKALLRSPGHKS